MVATCLIYCAVLNHNFKIAQLYKQNSIKRRFPEKTYTSVHDKTLSSITSMNRYKVFHIVKSCVKKNILTKGTLSLPQSLHGLGTKNSGYLWNLPHCQTEYWKRSFSFIANSIFNNLPLETFDQENFLSSRAAAVVFFLLIFFITSLHCIYHIILFSLYI